MKPEERARYVRVGLWLAFLLLSIWFVFKIYQTVLIFAIALFMAYLLNPLVKRLASIPMLPRGRGLSRTTCVVAVFVVLTLLVVLAMALVVPPMVEQSGTLISMLPAHIDRAQGALSGLQQQYIRLKISQDLRKNLEGFALAGVKQVADFTALAFTALGSVLRAAVAWFFYLISAFIVSGFLLISYDQLKERTLGYVPEGWREDVHFVLGKMNEIFGGFMKGTLLLSALNLVFTLVGLYVAGWFMTPFNYVILVSLVSGLTCAIPLVGIVVSCVIGGILGYIQTGSLVYALIIVAVIVGVNKFIDQFVSPKVMGDSVGVSPLFIIFAAFAGGEMLGVWGLLLGVPLAAITKVVFEVVYGRYQRELALDKPAECGKIEDAGERAVS